MEGLGCGGTAATAGMGGRGRHPGIEATTASAACGSKALFLEKVRQSNTACQNGDFETAVNLYTEAIALDRKNHILYSNRSAAYIKMGKFTKAYQDAVKAKELNPEWPKVH